VRRSPAADRGRQTFNDPKSARTPQRRLGVCICATDEEKAMSDRLHRMLQTFAAAHAERKMEIADFL
jgi:hypothetical protein